jgi:hypothetical protein
MTQLAAAELFGMNHEIYCRFEGGSRRPGGSWAARIEALTGGKVPASSWWQPPVSEAA